MKKEIIEKMELYISEEVKKIEDDNTLTNEQKLEAMFVLKNTYKFLKDYDKNIKILQKEVAKNRYERE